MRNKGRLYNLNRELESSKANEQQQLSQYQASQQSFKGFTPEYANPDFKRPDVPEMSIERQQFLTNNQNTINTEQDNLDQIGAKLGTLNKELSKYSGNGRARQTARQLIQGLIDKQNSAQYDARSNLEQAQLNLQTFIPEYKYAEVPQSPYEIKQSDVPATKQEFMSQYVEPYLPNAPSFDFGAANEVAPVDYGQFISGDQLGLTEQQQTDLALSNLLAGTDQQYNPEGATYDYNKAISTARNAEQQLNTGAELKRQQEMSAFDELIRQGSELGAQRQTAFDRLQSEQDARDAAFRAQNDTVGSSIV